MANMEKTECILQALKLNREMHNKLRNLENLLNQRLVKIRRLQKDKVKIVQKPKPTTYYPYFKDEHGSIPPDNEDTVYMREAEMYDFYSCSSSYFTVKDKRDFLKILLAMARDEKSKELFNSITKIKKEGKNNADTEKLECLLKQSIVVDKMELKDLHELVNDLNWNTVAQKLRYRHKPQEYRAMWNLFLHPLINKQEWTDIELLKLKEVAQNNNNQNWYKIARELNTGRSPYQCFVMYRTNIDINSGNKWTRDEDNILKNLMKNCKDSAIPWGRVAKSLANKTANQVYERWNNSVRPGLKKGRFTKEEDEALLACVNKYGTDFNLISDYIVGRSAKQLRQRYKCLDKFVSVEWTVEEDRKLMYLLADPSNQNKYSEIVHNFPGKKNYNLRMRYKTLVKWMNNNPEEDLASAPRRPPRRLYHGLTTKNVEKALQKLKQSNNEAVNTPSKEKFINSIVTKLINYKMKSQLLAKQKQRIKTKKLVSSYKNLINKNSEELKTENLRKLLILLRASVDEKSFKQSIYAKKYPDLLSPLKTDKTYSKVKHNIKDTLDICTNTLKGKRRYVLPPNLSTIIGCRNLMTMFREPQAESDLSITAMCNKSPEFKISWTNFVNRFTTLFFWPLMLSNIPPESVGISKGNALKNKTKTK